MVEKGKYSFNPFGTNADAMIPESKPGYKAGNELLDDISSLFKQVKSIAKRSAKLNKLQVNNIISKKLTNENIIERTLDSLLECVIIGENDDDFQRLLDYYKPISKRGYNFYRNEYKKLIR